MFSLHNCLKLTKVFVIQSLRDFEDKMYAVGICCLLRHMDTWMSGALCFGFRYSSECALYLITENCIVPGQSSFSPNKGLSAVSFSSHHASIFLRVVKACASCMARTDQGKSCAFCYV